MGVRVAAIRRRPGILGRWPPRNRKSIGTLPLCARQTRGGPASKLKARSALLCLTACSMDGRSKSPRRSGMAQFFFHVRNGTATVFKDETGDQLADGGDAM